MARVKTIERIQRYLDDCAARGHLSPTLREIADAVGIASSNTIHRHVKVLVAAGFCKRNAQGHIQLERPEPVARLWGTPYGDGESITLAMPRNVRLKAGRQYRVEVYEDVES